MKKTRRNERLDEEELSSPLKVLPHRLLNFTSIPRRRRPPQLSFSELLKRLLHQTRIQERPLQTTTKIKVKKTVFPKTEVPPVKAFFTTCEDSDLLFDGNIENKNKCDVCEVRARRCLVDRDVQCETKTFSEVAVQVSEEDLRFPRKSILKNRLFATSESAQENEVIRICDSSPSSISSGDAFPEQRKDSHYGDSKKRWDRLDKILTDGKKVGKSSSGKNGCSEGLRCYKCQRTHSSRDCPMQRDERCRRCGGSGHTAAECGHSNRHSGGSDMSNRSASRGDKETTYAKVGVTSYESFYVSSVYKEEGCYG